jgi:DNA repair protein RecO (recombination protein O)
VQTIRTDAIILGRTDYGEADRIVRFMTPDLGKIAAIAKGSRRFKSKSGGHLEPFGEVSLMLLPGRNLYVLTSASIKWYPQTLTGDYTRLGLAYMAASMVDRLIEDHHAQSEIYYCLLEALRAIDTGPHDVYFELWYKLRFLYLLGYRPELGHCAICGGAAESNTYWFSAEKGGILDATCHNSMDVPISQSAIKLWRILLKSPYDTILTISGGLQLARETIDICDNFYRYHLDRAFTPSFSDI